MTDQYEGQGGRFIVDEKTGKRRRVEEPTKPPEPPKPKAEPAPAPSAPEPLPQSPPSRSK